MKYVSQVNECGRGHEDDLQHPKSDVRDGEGVIVANVLTTGLFGVASEAGHLVSPHLLCGSTQDQDTEDEEHSQPHLAHHCRVLLGLLQELPQQVPVCHSSVSSDLKLNKSTDEYVAICCLLDQNKEII
ncbi:hypothetical protein NL108_005160 [Boleophthalmus pectinirostris]|nr:hypothetical protein NL108_005160 [Boleophthalmus pectinirostris]